MEDPFLGQRTTWTTSVQKGINRKYWNYRFPISQKAIKELKGRLQQVILSLNSQLTQEKDKNLLSQAENDLQQAKTAEELNEIRGLLVEQFSGYAGGKPFFGKKLQTPTAPAGKYRVTIEAKGREVQGWLTVRADPLLKHQPSTHPE